MCEKCKSDLSKKIQKLLSQVNWKYVAIYSCILLVTGLVLLVLNVTSVKHRPLFFILGGTCIFIGSCLILLSCCFFDEFKGVELTQANDLVNVQINNNLHSSTTSLTSGSPTSLYKPNINGSWSPNGPRSPTLPSVSLLTVPEEVFGFQNFTSFDTNNNNNNNNKPNSAGALSLQSNHRPSVIIALPRVSV